MDKLRDVWVRASLALSLALPIYFGVAALGSKVRLLDWRFATVTLTREWGAILVLGALGLALAGLFLALFAQPPRGRRIALVASLVPAIAAVCGYQLIQEANAAPPIHDISTDLLDPPAFSQAVADARRTMEDGNSLDLLAATAPNGRPVIDVQREHYRDISSIPTGLAPARAFDIALDLARDQHWNVTVADRDAGCIEAVSESFWYGLVDDVAVRIRPDGSGARIDMRSVSRVGVSDEGANARRMRPYLSELRRRLQEAES